jgi:tyrosine-protein kinase Etk/Wzc
MKSDSDAVDLRELAAAIRRGWRWIAAGAVGGLLLAAVVTILLRPRYEGTATVLLRNGVEGATSPLAGGSSRGSQGGGFSLGGLADMLSMASGFDTEIEILTSRSVIGAVVDSLALQARVLDPRGVSPTAIFSAARFDPRLERGVYRFERTGDAYAVKGPDATLRAVPGVPFRIGGSVLTLRAEGIPPEFEVKLMDLPDAIEQVRKRLDASRAGGEIAEVAYRAPDPVTAAAVPNAMITKYLTRRRTTDRGVNQYRYEFLEGHTDSIRAELALAEAALRRNQEESGVLDPAVYGKAELEQGLELRAALESAEVEANAFQQVLAQASAGTLSPRSLAAYPTFLKNDAINNLLSRLLELENQRTGLLDRRTESDPDVLVLDQQIRQLERQLVSMASSYLDGLRRQQSEIRRELGRYMSVLSALPAQAEANYRAEREVRRLSETLIALQTQLVQAKLAAIAEGGDVRMVDMAVPPKKPVFPSPFLNLAIGFAGGLFLGVLGALGSTYLSSRIREPRDAELATGIPAIMFESQAPLLLTGLDGRQSLLVIPVGSGADTGAVARRIAATAALQGVSVVLAEMADPDAFRAETGVGSDRGNAVAPLALEPGSDGLEPVRSGDGYLVYRGRSDGAGGMGVRAVLDELERRFSLVIAAVPPLDHATTTALLDPDRPVVTVVHAGMATRSDLAETAAALNRIGVSVVGVVVQHNGNGNGSRNA